MEWIRRDRMKSTSRIGYKENRKRRWREEEGESGSGENRKR